MRSQKFFEKLLTGRKRDAIISEYKEAERVSVLTVPHSESGQYTAERLTMCGDCRSGTFLFYNWGCFTISAKELYINDDIRAKEVRLLDENGEQLGIMDLDAAKTYAYDRDYDLVMIAPQAKPPVCRAMDYGKYCYEQDKREKEARKKQQTVEVKEVQLSCRIEAHDFETKTGRAKKFLSDGNKVRVCLRFKGREIAHQELGREMLGKFAEACAEFGTVDKNPVLEGRQFTMFLAPVKTQTK